MVTPPLVYLHGFGSDPNGSKASHCRAWAAERRIDFHAPDLNLPDFEHLTITAQVEAVEALLASLSAPPVLVGSSLGGLVGAAVAKRGAILRKLVLLAPAFGFAERRLSGPRWAGYRKRRQVSVFHHAQKRWITMGPELLEDLPNWKDEAHWQLPPSTVILHGRQDVSVPLAESGAFAARDSKLRLHVLEDDHSLLKPESLALLDQILEETLISRE